VESGKAERLAIRGEKRIGFAGFLRTQCQSGAEKIPLNFR
jgi:hypothetical protein